MSSMGILSGLIAAYVTGEIIIAAHSERINPESTAYSKFWGIAPRLGALCIVGAAIWQGYHAHVQIGHGNTHIAEAEKLAKGVQNLNTYIETVTAHGPQAVGFSQKLSDEVKTQVVKLNSQAAEFLKAVEIERHAIPIAKPAANEARDIHLAGHRADLVRTGSASSTTHNAPTQK